MKFTHVLIVLGLVLGFAITTTAQSAMPRQPVVPKATMADEVLTRQVGRWNTTVTVYGTKGREEKVYKSVSTSTLGCGGRCLIWDLKSEIAEGQPYHGHGIEVFDPVAKKYVGTWTDATSSGFTTSEYSYDKETNMFAGAFRAKNSRGVATRMTMTGDFKDPKERVMTMSMVGHDGIKVPVIRCAMVRQLEAGDPAFK
jgi:hypothetical protein